MIKLFSPEAFKDYATQKRYYSLQTVDGLFIDHMKVEGLIEEYRDKLKNPDLVVGTVLEDMTKEGLIALGENESDILMYDEFINKYESYFKLTGYDDIYINIKMFKANLKFYADWFIDAFDPTSFILDCKSSKWISATSGTVECYKYSKLKKELSGYLIDKHKDDIDDFLNDTESGFIFVSDRDRATTALGQVFGQARKKIFKDITISVADINMSDDQFVGGEDEFILISGNGKITVPGANKLGINNISTPTYFLNYTEFQNDYGNDAIDFIDEQVNNGVLVLINCGWQILPSGRRIISGRVRINNIGTFLVNYALFMIGNTDLNYQNNGTIVLQPTECIVESGIGDIWDIKMVHDMDLDGRYTYIQKGCILAIPIKTAREQTYKTQLYRVFDVNSEFNSVEVVAYPVFQESAFECPIDSLYMEYKTAQQVVDDLNQLFPEKYVITTDLITPAYSLYAQNSNLQEVLNGTQDGSFVNTYGGEAIYDNYHVHLVKRCGQDESQADNYLVEYGSNMTGINFTENTFDVVTRIYPCSSEGYTTQTIRQQMDLYSKTYGTITKRVLGRAHFKPDDLQARVSEIDRRYRNIENSNTIDSRRSSKWYIPGDWSHTSYPTSQEIGNFLNDMYKYGLINRTSGNIDIAIDKVAQFEEQVRMMRRELLISSFCTMNYVNKSIVVSPSDVPLYYDASNVRNYPFVHARSIAYDDIRLIEDAYTKEDKLNNVQKTKTQKAAEQAQKALKIKVASLTKKYIEKAHKGKWDYKKQIKLKKTSYSDQIHTTDYNQREDRAKLPYGYILYSFKDAMEYLKDEAVRNWCTDSNEADILCQGIEDGFRWCAKTNIAKWMWHKGKKNGKTVKYYGTKNRSDYVKYGYYNVGNKWYWFDEDGFVYSVKGETPDYLDDYKWVDETYEEQKKDKDGNPVFEPDGITPNMVTKHRYKYANNDGDVLTNCWIEESKNKHYKLDKDGYRVKFQVDSGTVDKDGNVVMKEIDHDEEDWSLKKSNPTLKINGYSYGNHDKMHYPARGQFMYIKDLKGWFYFDNDTGHIKGCYESDATWNWKKYKKGWRYHDGKGTYMRCQWAKIGGKWYFFDAEGGYADSTVDDFDENTKTFNTTNKHPELDYNREGVSSLSGDGTTEIDSDVSGDSYDASRDGVKAWIQAELIKEVKKEALKQHYNIWKTMNDEMANHARNSLEVMRTESLSVEVDFVQLANYKDYERFAYLQDLYLGDYVRVKSTYHGFDGHLRVIKMTQDAITGETISMTLGNPVNSFIKRMSKLNPKGIVKLYNPDRMYEDGYGDYFDDGNGRDPYLPID